MKNKNKEDSFDFAIFVFGYDHNLTRFHNLYYSINIYLVSGFIGNWFPYFKGEYQKSKELAKNPIRIACQVQSQRLELHVTTGLSCKNRPAYFTATFLLYLDKDLFLSSEPLLFCDFTLQLIIYQAYSTSLISFMELNSLNTESGDTN